MILKGLGVSKGTVTGKVRIIKNFDDHEKFEEGDILVTRLTDPTMIALMNKAGAIVCEIGGITSHPSIVSRELGIPCVVAASDATILLKDGETVVVDGEAGTIHKDEGSEWRLKWQN